MRRKCDKDLTLKTTAPTAPTASTVTYIQKVDRRIKELKDKTSKTMEIIRKGEYTEDGQFRMRVLTKSHCRRVGESSPPTFAFLTI